MKPLVLIISLTVLAACGADGAPFVPTANLGLNIGPNGVTPGATVGASNGTVSVGVGL
ncbi:hypothetical protein [Yoonia litorea]|uniref:Uncharacterized protein n=1 Tax=Yoonia litorea TaxID=1123755 RepID=A0A1I6L3E0_9RHOB|nr:hypothetical protein [Yoonia litorea]SFR98003.1 hypothetical protein SAMN05444714_0136 [Yoonia litorea]